MGTCATVQTPSNTREIIMISLDYYTTWGEVRSYTLYFPLHRKEGGGTTHYHFHYPNHHSWGPLKTWSCCSPTLLASIFRFDLKKEKPRLAQRFFSCLANFAPARKGKAAEGRLGAPTLTRTVYCSCGPAVPITCRT